MWGRVFALNLDRATLQRNNEFIIIIICYLMVSVITLRNLIKRSGYARHFWVLRQAMFMNDENKRHGQAIKIARETTNNQ